MFIEFQTYDLSEGRTETDVRVSQEMVHEK